LGGGLIKSDRKELTRRKLMNLRNKVIYVAGAYSPIKTKTTTTDNGHFTRSGTNIDHNINVAKIFAIELWEMGFTVICPHLNTAHFEQDCTCKYDDYLQGDLELLSRCDAIFMLPNWKYSEGAGVEKGFAIEHNLIKILHNLDDAKNWKEKLTDDTKKTE